MVDHFIELLHFPKICILLFFFCRPWKLVVRSVYCMDRVWREKKLLWLCLHFAALLDHCLCRMFWLETTRSKADTKWICHQYQWIQGCRPCCYSYYIVLKNEKQWYVSDNSNHEKLHCLILHVGFWNLESKLLIS